MTDEDLSWSQRSLGRSLGRGVLEASALVSAYEVACASRDIAVHPGVVGALEVSGLGRDADPGRPRSARGAGRGAAPSPLDGLADDLRLPQDAATDYLSRSPGLPARIVLRGSSVPFSNARLSPADLGAVGAALVAARPPPPPAGP